MGVTAGIFLASILLKEMRYLVYLRYLCLDYTAVHIDQETEEKCNNLLLLWKSARYLCSADQLNLRFVGWVILLFKKIASKEIKMTYLPPVQKPITDYAAFF